MNNGKLFKTFIGTIFSLVLMIPIVIQSMHVFDGHEHQVCDDISTHLHKKQLDCSICDFHFSIFDFKPQVHLEFLVSISNFKTQTEFQISEITADTPFFFLRGPPLIS